MGCPERPIDPDGGPVAQFASELRKLRDEAGLAQLPRAGPPGQFLGDRAFPGGRGTVIAPPAVVEGYVLACGGDVGEWEERWAARGGPAGRGDSHRRPPPAPYLGLASYGVEHARQFFGREALTRDLLHRLSQGRFLAGSGPSGSGKSSLLRAHCWPR